MKISVCMIVKDEELTIERAIKSAFTFADEVIVVDTGSTDNTVEIAKGLGAKIFYFKWIDDFAAARNYSFSLATGDYLMWLDADEYLTEESSFKIRELKKNACKDVYMFKTSVDYMGRQALVFYRERLIKSSLGLKWKGAVHEAIAPTGEVERTDIVVDHDRKKLQDSGRNLLIYRKMQSENTPFTPRDTYYFARELYYSGELDEAIEKFDEFLQKWGYKPDIECSFILLSDCFLQKKLYFSALSVMEGYLKLFEPYAEALCKIGEIYYFFGDLKKSIGFYERALNCKRKTDGFEASEYSDLIPYLQLTVIYYKKGEIDKALDNHKKAFLLEPGHPSVLYNQNFFKLKGLLK